MEPAALNSFLDQFLAVANSGFGLIQGDVTYVLNALIVISITLAGAQWALAGEAPMAPFFRKVLFVGLFAFLVNNWNALATAIVRSGAQLGLNAGGGAMSMADLHNPGRVGQIGVELFGRTIALAEGMNIFTDAIPMALIFIAALFVALGFFVLALQLFVSLIAFKLGSLAAFVALPWGVFNGTAWVAERPLGWVAGCAIRLFILALIASVSITFVDTLPATLTLDAGGALNVMLFGLTVLALAWFGPQLASEVVSGQPQLSGNDAYRAGVGGAVTGGVAGYASYQIARTSISLAGKAAGGAARMLGGGRSKSSSGGGSSRGGGASGGARPAIDYAAMRPRPNSSSKPSTDGASHELSISTTREIVRARPADTPYRRARQEWDARMGSAVLSARSWRATAFASLGLAALVGAGLVFVALQKRTFVHVVEVSPQGQVMSVRAAGGRWTPSEAQVAHHLGRWVRLVRSLPTDGVVLRENWLEAYRFLTPQAAAQLTEIARADDPFLSLGRVGRTVHIRSILARSGNAWEVSWIERATNATGTSDGEAYTGVFTITTQPPRNADEIAANPLGLLISDFSWSREQ